MPVSSSFGGNLAASSWYDDVMRTIIDLTDEQVRRLAEVCERERISRAEAIRRAVDGLLSQSESEQLAQKLRRAAEAWKAERNGETTDQYLGRIRAEWEH